MIQKIDGTAWTLTAVAGLALLSLVGDRWGSMAKPGDGLIELHSPNGKFVARILKDFDKKKRVRWVIMEGRVNKMGFIEWNRDNFSFPRQGDAILFAQDFIDTGYFSDPKKMDYAFRKAHLHEWSDI
jgi:hypothetical protein